VVSRQTGFEGYLGCCVVQRNRLEDCRSVIGDHNLPCRSRLQNFILTIIELVFGGEWKGDTIPLGPRVLLTRSPTAMAPTNED
jgi:hypothetical protein